MGSSMTSSATAGERNCGGKIRQPELLRKKEGARNPSKRKTAD